VRRGALLAGLVALAAAASTASGASAAAPTGPATVARLDGTFTAYGTVAKAVNVPGEHVGDNVVRTWRFVSSCPSGQCSSVQLFRQRGSATDQITLTQVEPGYYTGTAAFVAPVRCGRRYIRQGEFAPYSITLTITSTTTQGANVVATGFTATYWNAKRYSLTHCFTAPSHDKAHYVGVPAPPAS
jgi:hypothetical protein